MAERAAEHLMMPPLQLRTFRGHHPPEQRRPLSRRGRRIHVPDSPPPVGARTSPSPSLRALPLRSALSRSSPAHHNVAYTVPLYPSTANALSPPSCAGSPPVSYTHLRAHETVLDL